ncbi:MAG: homoserine kinase [Brevundimonas sp.]
MAVFTPVTTAEAEAFLQEYDLGTLVDLAPIAEGVENSNFRLETEAGRHVLTLFEGRTDAAALPFCLGLTAHLAKAGRAAAEPVANRSGEWIGTLNGRPAAIVKWVEGTWLRTPEDADQAKAGAELARLHLAAADYPGRRANPVGPDACQALLDRCRTVATGADAAMLETLAGEIAAWRYLPTDVPGGAIHADYFPDNVLFQQGEVSGVIDVYFACTGAWAYDLAIALAAWAFDADGGLMSSAFEAFLEGYQSVRPLRSDERELLPALGRAAATRFTLTRLHDRLFHDPRALVTPKDPIPFFRRLQAWPA